MDTAEKIGLIRRNTEEVVTEEELEALFEEKQHPHAYIGFACTGEMHVGYMIPIRKIVDFLNAGCRFTFLIADLHAYLDDNKTPWPLLDARYEYYKTGCIAILEAFGAPLDKVEFVRGSDFEFDREYMEHVLQMVGETTLNRARRAASEVVRFKDDPRLGGFVYPFLQIEDVYALDADIAFGGIDQRGIYMLGRDVAARMDRDKYVCVFTPLLPGLTGEKMSASDAASRIGLLDSPDEVAEKVNKAHCPAGEKTDNGILSFMEHVVMPHLSDNDRSFVVERPEKYGGDLSYGAYAPLEEDFLSEELHPLDLKNALVVELESLLETVRDELDASLLAAAYPDE